MTQTLLIVGVACLTATPGPLEVATVKAFKGTEGQSVEVAMLKPIAQGAALLRVRRSGSSFDGLVLRCAVEDRGRGRGFTTRFHGASYELLRLDEGTGRVYFPEVKDFAVNFDEDGSGKSQGSELVSEHEKQLASGAISLFEKKDFPHLVTKYEAKAAAATAELGKACGAAPSFTFQWSSFSDEAMENIDAWAVCQPLLAQARAKCGTLKGVGKLVCRIGPKLELTRADDTLTFTTTLKGAAEGPSFVAAQLGK